MTHPHIPTASTARPARADLRPVLERAQRLSESRPDAGITTEWSHEAFHVGDLAVLALALRK